MLDYYLNLIYGEVVLYNFFHLLQNPGEAKNMCIALKVFETLFLSGSTFPESFT